MLLASGSDPLEFLCAVAANDELDIATRLHAAGLALPHLHPRLSAVAIADAGQKPTRADPRELIDRLNAQLARLGPAAATARTIEAEVAAEPAAPGEGEGEGR